VSIEASNFTHGWARSTGLTAEKYGLLGSLPGSFMIAPQASATSQINGLNLLIPALAASLLGASAFNPGQFNVLGTIVGLLLVAVPRDARR
jgi:predicted ABC-type sugar transport system permease subunit